MSQLILDEFLPFRLNRLAAEFSSRMHSIYEKMYGIDVPEWRTLVTLGSKGPVTAQYVVASTRTNKSTISRAVQRLEQRGWIERSPMDEDRRNMMLSLTADGKKVYDDIAEKVLQIESDVLTILGDEAADHLHSISRLEEALNISEA